LIGNVLTKATQFLLLPLYTKYINPNDFGTYDLHIAYITFLSSILFFDIWGGIMRFMFDYKEHNEKAKPVTNGLIIFASSTFVYTIVVAIMGVFFNISYIGWLYLYGLSANIAQVVGYVARALKKDYIFAIGGFLGTLVNVASNIIFIALLQYGYKYMYVSYCLGMIVNVLFVGINIRFYQLIKREYFDKTLFISMLQFAMPLSLNSAAFWFLTSYNKIVINQQLSVTQNGMYAVANKFSAMINLVTQCFQMAWQELTFSKAGCNKEEMGLFYTKAINEYIKFLSFGTLALIPMIKIIFPYMIDASYSDAENLIPFTLIGALFSCISSFVASIISTIKKNRMIFTTTIMGSVVNIVFIHLFIGTIGIYAAVCSLAMGYIVVVIRRIMLLRKYISIHIDKKMIFLLSTGFAMVCFIYIKRSPWENFLCLCVLCFIIIYSYKELLKKMYMKLRGR
ncbi:MAG: lipopolysaccharide biosynthesis protein, partial [Lachnospiraceae bacterium]|nr:lipopolysaccharide biosynthesis protein [Lachnospiraceae bacterium]